MFFLLLISFLLFFLLRLNLQNRTRTKYLKQHGIVDFGGTYINFLRMTFSKFTKFTILDMFKDQYQKVRKANASFGHLNDFGVKVITIFDPEMLKNILVKDFDHFIDRRGFFKNTKSFMGKALMFMTGSPWKILRSKLSPTFTTGKIKRLFPLFDESAGKLVSYLKEQGDGAHGEVNLTDGYSKLTMDVIANAVCGINSQTFNQHEPSLFEKMGKQLEFKFSLKMLLRFIIATNFPTIGNLLGITMFGKEPEDFFQNGIKASIAARKQSGVGRNDFMQIMLEAREGKLKLEESELGTFEKDAQLKEKESTTMEINKEDILNDDAIAANCVLFILAGYDVTQSLLSFCTYELALHPEIQDRLRLEVEESFERDGGKFSYEGVMGMKYLDMVITETVRKYPSVTNTDRGCTQDYTFPGTNITIKKGEVLTIPIYGIQHDERYYPQPEKFDPERFSSEKKGELVPYTLLTFGQGPRNCIGMRFALAEVKLVIAHIVHSFTIQPSSKTVIPMEFENNIILKPKDGMFLAFNPRN